jgi:hypothetical protein
MKKCTSGVLYGPHSQAVSLCRNILLGALMGFASPDWLAGATDAQSSDHMCCFVTLARVMSEELHTRVCADKSVTVQSQASRLSLGSAQDGAPPFSPAHPAL